MAYIDLAIDPSPSGEGYDDSLPTQNNELLAAQIHNTLEDMDDSGTWYISNDDLSTNDKNAIASALYDNMEVVFNYAKTAITNFRATGSPGIAKPVAYSVLTRPLYSWNKTAQKIQWENYNTCLRMMWAIWYMWGTETDPLRIKDYIRDMLVAWPLMDTTISLKDEGGSELKIYPSWSEFG